MRGAVRPRVLAVAAAAAVCLVALGAIASLAVWGYRHGDSQATTTVGGWLAALWISVAIAIVLVGVVALAAVRALRRSLLDLSRQATQLQVERIPSALREIEAGGEPAPRPGFTAPPELEGVAGALENLERFVHYHAKRAQRADRELGRLLAGAADRVGARARVAEGIDFGVPADFVAGLRRDEDAIRALLPETETKGSPAAAAATEPVPGPSVSETVTMAARTTLRPASVGLGALEPALIDEAAGEAVVVVLGEVLDVALAIDGDVLVHGSAQPEGYHFVIDAPIGDQSAELTVIAESLRERDSLDLPFGLRAAVQAGRRSRLLVWVTVSATAQWHVLVPPDSFVAVPVAHVPVVAVTTEPEPAPVAPEPEPVVPEPAPIVPEPVVPEPVAPEPVLPPPRPSRRAGDVEDAARVASDRRLGEELTTLFARLEVALDHGEPDGSGVGEDERVALLVDGTRLVGELQQAGLCSSRALRALLRAIDVAVGADRTMPLTGSARAAAILPREILTEIQARIEKNSESA